jgi:hypothetical protein
MMDAKKFLGCLAVGALLAASLGTVETLAQRRRQVEAMSVEQRDDLFRSERQFRDLPPEEQKRIRDLHDQIESARDREMLRATMHRYYKWVETQPPIRRAKLLDKKSTLKERVATVKEFLANPLLDERSRRALTAWLDHYTAEHGIESLSQGPHAGNPRALFERQRIAEFPPDRQKAIVREILLRRWQMGGPNGQMPITEQEMARLHGGLTPDLRAKLEAKKPAEQTRIIHGWLRETASHELNEQLAYFFEKTISDEERDRLMRLPSEKMYEDLGKEYGAYMLKPSNPGEPPRGERPGWRGRHPGPRRLPENRDEHAPAAKGSNY